MFEPEYNVLIVDDDPDVLAVSKLAMRNFTVYGSPVKLHTATSKAEAIEVITSQLSTPATAGGKLGVAIIDVVMETDTAGLELCDYIRNDLGNKWCQLYVRTGQPGVAPERAVIDKYEINGYFTKVEASEDKLYTIVKTGVRMTTTFSVAQAAIRLIDAMIEHAASRDTAVNVLRQGLAARNPAVPTGISLGDKLVVFHMDEPAFHEMVGRLNTLQGGGERPGHPLNDQGDKYVIEGNEVLIKVAESPTTVEAFWGLRLSGEPSETVIELLYLGLRGCAAVIKRAA
jgi:CheY-like chemotaxis protein